MPKVKLDHLCSNSLGTVPLGAGDLMTSNMDWQKCFAVESGWCHAGRL